MRIENFVDPYLRKEFGAWAQKSYPLRKSSDDFLGYQHAVCMTVYSRYPGFLNASELSLDRFDSSSLKKSGPLGSVILVAAARGRRQVTIAANIALALKEEGAVVGLLDADIYGPSQGILLGRLGVQNLNGA